MSYNRLLQSVQVATENLKKIPEEIKKIVEYCLKDEDNAWSKDTVELLVCYHIFKKMKPMSYRGKEKGGKPHTTTSL